MKRQRDDSFEEDEHKNQDEASRTEDDVNRYDEDDERETRELVECFENAVNNTESLCKDVKLLWDQYGGSRDNAKSFWVPYSSEPRCLLEATALQIGKFHLQDFEFSGVEFWAQYRSSNDGLGFHFDKDEHAAREENLWKHPTVATATYLSNEGAPLVVFETHSAEDIEENDTESHLEDTLICLGENDPSNPPQAWVIFPRQGRHVVFSGGLLHGVASELTIADPATKRDNAQNEGRLSFLVNVWLDHKPKEIEQLPDEKIRVFSSKFESAFQLKASNECACTQEIEVLPTSTLINLKEHVPGDTGPLPLDEILQIRAESKDPPLIKLIYKNV